MTENKINGLKEFLYKRRHKTNEGDKIPSITHDLDYIYLDWEYKDQSVNVRAKDSDLIAVIKRCIKIYLE